MFKLSLLILSCFISLQCFSQSPEKKDSVLKSTGIESVEKNTSSPEASLASLKIYPNPAKSKISLSVAGFEPGMVVVKITDTKGKIRREDSRLLTNGTEEIAMFLLLQPGIYFISVSAKNKIAKKKLIIL